VLDHNDKPICDSAEQRQIEQALRAQLLDPRKGRDPLKAHLPRSLKQFPIRTKVNFSDTRQGNQTMIEVLAQDRPGLLFQIAEVFDECEIKLRNAKIATFGARVEDIFVVTDLSGDLLNDPAQQECVRSKIVSRLDGNMDTAKVIDF
jgi:[protein-PII] uridylyltransferase